MNNQRIPDPYDSTLGKTEWTCASLVAQWINEIIKIKNLDLGEALVETKKKNEAERNDVVIRAHRGSDKVLCCIEFKAPYYSAFDEKNLKNPARDKANQFKSPYFCTSNFQLLIWYNTARANENVAEEQQIHEKYHLSEVENLDLIEEPRFKKNIQDALTRFVVDLYEVHTRKKAEPLLPVDAFLIFRLQEKIKTLSKYYKIIIENKAHKDTSFSVSLQQWFFDQNWSFAWQDMDFEKAARQAAYLLVNKILFYDLLQAKRPHDFDPLNIPEDLTKGGLLQAQLDAYFRQVLRVDYETIYSADFIDQVAFPDDKRVVWEIKELIGLLRRYDFSRLGFDVIGGIFERLIPAEERHILGQYFTNPDVVDLILRFCLRHEDDKVFDPSCGAGTFLVRSYKHKQLMNQRLTHEQILKTLWGTDIAKFPAHLSTINLAINDLASDRNYPQILKEDFFNLNLGGKEGFEKGARKKKLVTFSDKEVTIDYPKVVDSIVGNPPYTRQEEIDDISDATLYKDEMIRKALHDGMRKIADISRRAGIYAYFFVHGTKFLQNGGHFGFVVSNAWLDVEYGKGLQEFFLTHYKIVAIVESKVERWFVDADINTCIVILERCTDKVQRDENLVRFVYLFRPLRNFIPAAQDLWEKQLHRLTEIDKLIKTIIAHDDFYQNDDLRIFPKKQSELWEEGLEIDEETGENLPQYAGSKWGKYLRAPEIYFQVLRMTKSTLVPLRDIADVRFGIKTGANEFFYLSEEEIREKKIEKEFWMHKDNDKWVPNYVIKSPKECNSIVVDRNALNFRVLMIHKDKKDLESTAILRWINSGERRGFQRRPTCASRKPRWYDLGQWEEPDFVWSDAYNDRFAVYDTLKTWGDKRFFFITVHDKTLLTTLHAYLNSTLIPLLIEIGGITNLGEGAIYTNVYWLAELRVPTREKQYEKKLEALLENLKSRRVESIFDEIGAKASAEVSLDKVNADRRALDEIVMGKILGLTEEQQLDVYLAVVDLVRSRLQRARSVGKKKKIKEGVDVDALVKVITEKVGDATLGAFYKKEILSRKPLTTKALPHGDGVVRIDQEIIDWYLYVGKHHVKCSSELEARYLKVWAEVGLDEVKIPKDTKVLQNVVPKLEKLKSSIDAVVNQHLNSILDRKVRAKIAHFVWEEMAK